MKFKVDWTSPKQGICSTTVEALNMGAAKEQVESMYAGIKGFKAFCISPVFDNPKHADTQSLQKQCVIENSTSHVNEDDCLSTSIGGLAITIGAAKILIGLVTLPTGLVGIVAGVTIGWLGMQLAYWLSDRGW
jgi:hypothetical protein